MSLQKRMFVGLWRILERKRNYQLRPILHHSKCEYILYEHANLALRLHLVSLTQKNDLL